MPAGICGQSRWRRTHARLDTSNRPCYIGCMNGHPIADFVELPATPAVVSVPGSDGGGGHWSAECWRREVIEARSRAGALAAIHRQNKAKLEAARAEIRELRRQAKEPLRAAAEAARLRRLLEQMSVDPRRRSTIASLRQENGELRRELEALREANAVLRQALEGPRESGRLARRIAALEQQLRALKTMRSNDTRHRFGDRSERQARAASPRRRGQQPGCPGPGRTPRAALEARPEIRELPAAERSCRQCGQPYAAHGLIQSELIEIQVVAHTRRLRRQRYRKVCGCAGPATVAAPPVPRLFPHTAYGISVWATLLLERFAGQRPFRQIARWMTCHGLPISPGTLCDRLGDLASLFEPLSQAIRAHLVTARVLQGDETSWRVQDSRRDGGGRRAWLWVGRSRDAVWFHIDPERSRKAALKVFEISWSATASAATSRWRANSMPGGIMWTARGQRTIRGNAAGWSGSPLPDPAPPAAPVPARQDRQSQDFHAAQQPSRCRCRDAPTLKRLPARTEPRAEPLRRLLEWRQGLERFVADPEVPIATCERSLRAGHRPQSASQRQLGRAPDGHAVTLQRHRPRWLMTGSPVPRRADRRPT